MSRSRSWILTLNNWTIVNYQAIRALAGIVYGVLGKEIAPETKTPHLQGYLYLKNPTTLRALKRKITKSKGGTPHLEIARGTPQQNRKYCTKGKPYLILHSSFVENDYEEWGQLPRPGARSDIQGLLKAARKTNNNTELWKKFPQEMTKYYKAVERMRTDLLQEKNEKDLENQMKDATLRRWQTIAVDRLLS